MSVEESAIAALRAAGWRFEPSSPAGAVTWAGSFSLLSNADETVWFLAREDYARPGAFAWNEFETMSRDAAATEQEAAEIADFWQKHQPILLSVRGPYAYLAVCDDGPVVYGEDPEFEQAHVVAGDLAGLLRMIADRSVPEAGVLDRLLFGP